MNTMKQISIDPISLAEAAAAIRALAGITTPGAGCPLPPDRR